MELRLSGLSATVENAEPVVPKNTPGGIRIIVRAGAVDLSLTDLIRFLGPNVSVQGEISGPGFSQPVALPLLQAGEELPADPLILPTPPIPIAGNYRLSNLRVVAGGRTVLDVEPSSVPLRVIDQILVTQVTTRSLTLDEIRGKGIVLDSDDYLGFEFTMGFKLDSKAIDLKFPVVFDRQGVAVPQPLSPPAAPSASGVTLPTIVPLLLEAEGEDGVKEELKFPSPTGVTRPITIPAVLVIPGNVGYLKQFFSAQLYVSNGAPVGSGLNVRDIQATLKLPPGPDLDLGTEDDPLALPELEREGRTITQPLTAAVRGLGPDGLPETDDDVAELAPAEQGQAEFLIRGEQEGFHPIAFDLTARLLGLPIGPVTVRGKASGGVLVRNPYFNVTFTVPSVVRTGERFKMRATVTNIGKGVGNDVSMTLDSSRMSGLLLQGEATKSISTLKPGDARGLEFEFIAQRTGKVVATYLKFDTQSGSSGRLNFTIGVGERNVPLSPDTLVLPASTDGLPTPVVDAAMRVLGQAWSIANAPAGTLPRGVTRVNGQQVVKKALALAEAGLRVTLGQSGDDAVRDLLYDFYSGDPVDPGFDQLLRTTEAGDAFVLAVGDALADSSVMAGGGPGYEGQTSRVLASAAPFVSFAWDGGAAQVSITDAAGRVSTRATDAQAPVVLTSQNVVGAVLTPLGSDAVLGLVTQPTVGPYRFEVRSTASSMGTLSGTWQRPDGSFARTTWSGVVAEGTVLRLIPNETGAASLQRDADGDGVFEGTEPLSIDTLAIDGPRLVAAALIGPETLDGAGPWGFNTAFVFDRVVAQASAARNENYSLPSNRVRSARRQLSGRLVFGSLELPEGPYIPSQVSVSGIQDAREAIGPSVTVPLTSRLEDIGAVVSGRVLDAEGTPLAGRVVTYSRNPDPICLANPPAEMGMAALSTGPNGEFEIRYVNQGCGGFRLSTTDPNSGALRKLSLGVRERGEQIVADFVMLGAGSATGVVKGLSGQPVPGARVVVLSQTEPQVGASAVTDALGRYAVSGVTVGPVVVRAAKGNAVGSAAGRIDRPNVPAVIDLTLLDGAVSARGVVRKIEEGVASPAAGAVVSYAVSGSTMAAMLTDSQGRYAFVDLPVGPFTIKAQVNTRDQLTVSGVALAGDEIVRDISVEIPPPASFGYVDGVVRMPDGSPAADAIVSYGLASVLSGPDGAFRLPVKPQLSALSISATTRDRKRQGSTSVIVNTAGQTATGAVITLSGLGAAEFTVLDPMNQPLVGLTVRLLDSQVNPCGRTAAITDAQGRARFSPLGIGRFTAQVQGTGEVIDSARADVSVTGDGATGFAILRLETRASSISGVVRDAFGQPVFGAEVVLSSPVFVNDPFDFICGMQLRVSHRARTGLDGRYRFTGVHPGRVTVTASQDFFPVPVSRAIDLAPATAGEADLTLVNTISGEISGNVFEPDGATSAGRGVEVTLNGALPDVTVVTDANGHFRFAKIFPAGSYVLTARDPITGLLDQSRISIAAAVDAVHDIRLKGKARVTVRVTDALAQPVAQAYVTLKETAFPNRTFEGLASPSNQGVLDFPGVFEGPVSVEARDPFGRGGRSSLTIPSGVSAIETVVRLTTTGTVRGRFLMPSGTPIPYGGLKLYVGGRLLGQVTASGANPAGGFEFAYVPSGDFRIEALDPLTGRTGIATGFIGSEGEVVDVDVTAQGIGRVQGLVLSNGLPSRGARVEVVSGPYSANTSTDSDGRYDVLGVPEGRVVVNADTGNGFLRASASGTLQGDGSTLTLDISLRSTGAIRGRVFKAGGVTPAGVVGVSLSVGGVGGGSVTGSTDEDGWFEFDRVPSGLAQVSVDALGSDDFASGSFEVPAGGRADVTLTLNGVGGLTGTGLDSAGLPTLGRLHLSGGPAQRSYYYVVDLAANGQFQIPKLLAGPFTARLQVGVGSLILWGTASGAIVDGETATIEVRVQDSAAVTGRVLRADGVTPAYGSSVTVQLASYAQTSLQAQPDGRFTFRGLTLGAFTVRATDPVTTGVGRTSGSLTTNGETFDVGDIVLDDSPVQVVAVEPADGATGVAVNQPVRVTFSDPLSGTGGVFLLTSTGASLGVKTLSTDGRVVTFSGNWPDSKEYTIEADTSATDVFGRHPAVKFTSRFRTRDLTPPSVTSVSPANASIQVGSDTSVVVTFSEDLDPAADLTNVVRLSMSATPIPGLVTLTGSNQATFTPASPLPINAILAVQVTGARDLSGNTQTTTFASVFKSTDTVPPVLTQTSPSATAWVTTRRPPVAFSLSDALTGVDGTSGTLRLDGLDVTPVRSASSVSFSPAVDLADGTHELIASARDLASNVGTLLGSFRVDATPPAPAEITGGVAPGASVAGTITLAATSSDATSGLAKIEILEGAVVRATLLPPTFGLSYNTHTLSEGSHAFTARATDVAGNVGSLGASVSFFADNTALSLAITAPTSGLKIRDSVVASASVSEPVGRVTFAVGGTSVDDLVAPYSATLDTSGLPEGTHTITVTAYALTGEPTSATVNVNVDRTPPASVDREVISAEDQGTGLAQVVGRSGAAVGAATVEVRKCASGTSVVAQVAGDGSFATLLPAVLGDCVEVRALDSVGNPSAWVELLEPVTKTSTEEGLPQIGMSMWLKASAGVVADGAGLVSSWADQSVKGNHLTQAIATKRPTLVQNGFNGYPVLHFDGTSSFMSFTTRMNATVGTVFMVLREDAGAPAGTRTSIGDSFTTEFVGSAAGLFGSGAARVQDGTFINGVPAPGGTTARPTQMSIVTVVPTTTPLLSANVLGYSSYYSSYYWKGDFAEVIIYDRRLNDTERVQVETYLAQKYQPVGATVVSPPRMSPAGSVFNGSTTVSLSAQPGASIRYTTDGSDPQGSPTALDYSEPILLTTTTTLKARAHKSLDMSTLAVSTFVDSAEAPPLQSNLLTWLRADAGLATDAKNPGIWVDQSSKGNHLVQAIATKRPTLIPDGFNGRPVLHFDGASNFMSFTTRMNATVGTVFMVLREDAGAPTGPRTALGDNSTTEFVGSPTGLFGSGAARVQDGTFINGVPAPGGTTARPTQMSIVTVVPTTTPLLSANVLGYSSYYSSYYWKGDFAEVIIYDRRLNDTERVQVETYLAQKYQPVGATVVSPPRMSPAGSVFNGSTTVSLSAQPGASIRYTTDGSDPSGSLTALDYIEPILLTATTTVKARASRGFDTSELAVATFVESAEAPPLQSNLLTWLRADAGLATDGKNPEIWLDQSSKGNHLLQPTSTKRPTLIPDGFNGRPVVHFDGASDFMTFTARMAASVGTVFMVLREDAGAPAGPRTALGDNSTTEFVGSPTALFGSGAVRVQDGTFINGVPAPGGTTPRPTQMSIVTVVPTTTPLLSANVLGYSSYYQTYYWKGDVAEVIIYDRRLSDTERVQVETYLAQKHQLVGATVISPPRMSPAGSVFSGSTSVSLSAQPGASIRYTTDGSDPSGSPSALDYSEPILLTTTTTLKARAYKGPDNSLLAVATFVESAAAPPLQANLLTWLRADAGLATDARNPGVWLDQSSKGNHLLQATSTKRPTLIPDGFNGRPVLRFDGTSNFMTFTTRMAATIGTVFMVLREDAGSPAVSRTSLGDNATTEFLGSPTALFGSGAVRVQNGTFVNGLSVPGGTTVRPTPMSIVTVVPTTTPLLSANALGYSSYYSNYYWKGDFAEILLYDFQLSTTQRQSVEAYLKAKYGIQ